MPKVVREDLDNLNAVLTVTIEKPEYEPRFEEELKKYRNKASFKGFRKGKVPLSFLKKAYGQSVLAELVNSMLQEEILKFLREDETSYLGQPIPSDDQQQIDFDLKSLGDYEFKFDLGIAPEFEVQGLSPDSKFEQFEVTITDELVEQDLDIARRRLGERVSVDVVIEENDLVQLQARELEGDAPKEGGREATFSILVDRIADEKVKKEILTKKKGDELRFNIFKLETNETEEYAKRYLLHMTEEEIESTPVGEQFVGTITEVSRIQPAELNQEFFDKHYGEGEITSEQEARDRIRDEIRQFYLRQSEGLLFRDFQEFLMEKNRPQLELPDAFMKRWLQWSDEQNTAELIDKDYENFADSLRWSLIRGKLARQFEIKVTTDEIRAGFAERIKTYMGGAFGDPMLLERTIDRLIQDEKQVESVVEDLTSYKLFERIKAEVSVTPKPIGNEEFQEVVRKVREEQAAKQQAHEHDHEH